MSLIIPKHCTVYYKILTKPTPTTVENILTSCMFHIYFSNMEYFELWNFMKDKKFDYCSDRYVNNLQYAKCLYTWLSLLIIFCH